MNRWSLLARVASQQFGLIAVWQAAELGITRQLVANREAEHGWTRVGFGVYLLPGHSLTPLARIKAVELALHLEGVAAGSTALYIWRIIQRLRQPVPFLVRPDCSRRPNGAKITQSAALVTRDPALRSNILVTDPAWSICTAAREFEVADLKRHVMTGHRLRLLTPTSVRRTAEELGPFKGRPKVFQALREIDSEGITHSQLERLGRDHLVAAGLCPHPHPYAVEHDGRLIAELDIAFIAEKVGIPIQGPHHFEEDQRRFDEDQRYLLESIGWRIITADERRLREQGALFVRQVRDALQQRRTQDLSR